MGIPSGNPGFTCCLASGMDKSMAGNSIPSISDVGILMKNKIIIEYIDWNNITRTAIGDIWQKVQPGEFKVTNPWI